MILTRSNIVAQLEERLAQRISAERLSEWAVDLFYAIEQGEMMVVEEDHELILTILDDLMFADSPSFALDEPALQRLIARLHEL